MPADAGLEFAGRGTVQVINEFPDLDLAVRALAAAGPSWPALHHAGQDRFRRGHARGAAPALCRGSWRADRLRARLDHRHGAQRLRPLRAGGSASVWPVPGHGERVTANQPGRSLRPEALVAGPVSGNEAPNVASDATHLVLLAQSTYSECAVFVVVRSPWARGSSSVFPGLRARWSVDVAELADVRNGDTGPACDELGQMRHVGGDDQYRGHPVGRTYMARSVAAFDTPSLSSTMTPAARARARLRRLMLAATRTGPPPSHRR
jgi:hypothetical protein